MQRTKFEFTRLIASLTVLMMLAMNCLPTFRVISYALEEDEVVVSGLFQVGDGEKADSASLDVNESEAKLVLDAQVNGKGYLKSGTFEIEENANFKVKDDADIEVDENKVQVKVIDQSAPDQIVLPIEFRTKAQYEYDYFNKANRVTFTGIYVDNNGDEQKIQKDIWLELGWSEEIDLNIESEVIKNIEYTQEESSKRVVQTILKLSDANVERRLPVQSAKVEIEIPQISDMNLEEVNIDAEKLLFSQGTEDDKVSFSENDYSVENNKITINVPILKNKEVAIDNFGEDIYILTFVYNGQSSNVPNAIGKVTATVDGFTGVTEEEVATINYDLSNVTKQMVSYYRENKTETISQGYLVADTILNRYEISYNRKDIINITRADLVSSVEIYDEDEYFTTEDGRRYSFNTNYSSISFSKAELMDVLGEEGYVDVLDERGNQLARVAANINADAYGTLTVSFTEDITKAMLKTSVPVNDGKISVISNKKFDAVNYSREEVSTFTELVNTSHGRTIYKDGNYDDLKTVESSISITPVFSDAELTISNNKLSTISVNEGVNLQIYLNNGDDKSDLYIDPIFEIVFPKSITDINVTNMNLFYGNNELSISGVEVLEDSIGRKVLRVSLAGSQVSYDLNAETNGTVVSLDADIQLDEYTTGVTEDIEMLYANFGATGYFSSTDWRMLSNGKGENGVFVLPITYDVAEGLINAQTTEIEIDENTSEEVTSTEENDSSKVVSIKQGLQDELLEEGTEAKLATMSISVLNNTSKRYTEFSILGRIPFAGNKDVRTGEDLGTTVDTILSEDIVSVDPSLLYDVYYSENPEATDNLFDEANGWTREHGKSGLIKSYLIIIDPNYVLEPRKTLEFEYEYIIPADLQPGDALYGTYASFYKEIIGDTVQDNKQANESADAVGYRTEQKATVELNVNLSEGSTVQGDFDTSFDISIKNTSDIDAKNVYAQINMPNYLKFLDVSGADATANVNQNTLNLMIPLVRSHEERTATVKFKVENSLITEEIEDKLQVGVFGNNLNEVVTAESETYQVLKTEFLAKETISHLQAISGASILNSYSLYNITDEDYGRVTIHKEVSSAFDVEEVGFVLGDEDITATISEDKHSFDVTIEDFSPEKYVMIEYKLKVNYLGTGKSENIEKIITTIDIKGNSISSEQPIVYYEPVLDVRTITNNETGFSKEGETLDYEYEIINQTEVDLYTIGLDLKSYGNQKLNYIKVVTPSKGEIFYDAKLADTVLLELKAHENAKVIINVTVEATDKSINNKLGLLLNGIPLSDAIYETTIEKASEDEGHSIVGMAFLDRNNNNKQDEEEEVLDGIVVNLYDSVTNELIETTITNVGGRYEFKHKDDGKYYVKFDYDQSKYRINANDNAKVLNIKKKNLTDNIELEGKSISSVDLSLTDENVFDLSLDAKVSKITVQNKAENTNIVVENGKLAKVDINPEIVNGSKVFVEYTITVKNQGSIPGKVNKIVDYMPSDFTFDQTLNSGWYMEPGGILYTRNLVNEYINPGEERELTLVLLKSMTGENTGLAHNTFEIAEATNRKGIKDIDSTPNNKLSEDDLSSADLIIGISTGLTLKLIPVIIGGIIVAAMIGALVWRIIDRRRYV